MSPNQIEQLASIQALANAAPLDVAALRVVTAILNERKRQRLVEGFSAEHDDKARDGQLADAAASYAYASSFYAQGLNPPTSADLATLAKGRGFDVFVRMWPWTFKWFKPTASCPTLESIPPRAHQRQCLVKAGALILAELERLERLDSAPP